MKVHLKQWQITILVFSAIFIFHASTILHYPPPFVDEAWLISRAWAYMNTGKVFGPLDSGVFDRFDGYWTFFPWFHTWVLGIGLKLIGGPNLCIARIVSLLFGILLLVAIYCIGKNLGGFRLAIVGVILVSLSKSFGISSHLVRYDIVGASLGYIAVALYLSNKQVKPWVSLVSGLLIGLAFEAHPNSIIFIPAIALLYLREFGWKVVKIRGFWFFALGVIVGFCFYLLLHVLPYPATYQAIMRILFGKYHKPPILSLDVREVGSLIEFIWNYLIFRFFLLSAVIVIALGFYVKRRRRTDQILLILVLSLFFCFTLFIRNRDLFYYEIYISPIMHLFLAVFLLDFMDSNLRKPKRNLLSRGAFIFIGTAYLSTFILNLYFFYIVPLFTSYYPLYEQAQQRINQSIKPFDTIMAAQTYWLGLSGHKYYSWENLPYYRWYVPESTMADEFQHFHPDIFIIDQHVRNFITDEPQETLYSGLLALPREELEAFLSENAILVDEFYNDLYGVIQIYRFDWTK